MLHKGREPRGPLVGGPLDFVGLLLALGEGVWEENRCPGGLGHRKTPL